MVPGTFALIDEMNEAPELIARFDPSVTHNWARTVQDAGKAFLTGEGSSRIFPAKNLIDLAFLHAPALNLKTEGARQAAEYDLRDWPVIGASNSGRTRETISLFKANRTQIRYAVTADTSTPLAQTADDTIALSCGAEKAVAATKSVIEQALVLQSILQGAEWENQRDAAKLCRQTLEEPLPFIIITAVAQAPAVYFAGRNNGVAEELTLKTNEIIRKKASYLEGTYILHGIEEIMQPSDTVVLVDPFAEEMERYEAVLKPIGVNVIAISPHKTPFHTINIPKLDGFNGYIQLMAGWNLLVAAGLMMKIDLDTPVRARKVGNAV